MPSCLQEANLCSSNQKCLIVAIVMYMSGFHLATKVWDTSAINEWVYLACQVPWTYFRIISLNSSRLFQINFDQNKC